MRRLRLPERPGWEEQILADGLVYSPTPTPDGGRISYWREGAAYELTPAEVATLEAATAALFEMCVGAGDWLAERPDVLTAMGIPDWAHEQVVGTWHDEPAWQSVYGRFDLRFGGLDHPDPALRVPTLYEFNADTPTCLVESAYAQWRWREQVRPSADQWNQLYERLVEAWRRNLGLAEKRLGHRPLVHFTCSSTESSGEDVMNTQFLRDTCAAAGYDTKTAFMEGVLLGADGRFYDGDGVHLDVAFKLYPWEFMVAEEFGRAAFADMATIGRRDGFRQYRGGTVWIEAPYKMMWSNKGLLAVLWARYGDDPGRARHLIPAWFADPPAGLPGPPADLAAYVRKPLLGREGASIEIVRPGAAPETVPGEYGAEGYVVQSWAPPPTVPTGAAYGEVVHPVLGAWLVDGEPAGLGIRESAGPITDNLSHFVPHVIGE
ncbi:putative glutathionylspermidine synthase [Pilimelia anulata]|uniref:Putative glutathionylspermidine synthase n=1 Tax=Pilimelia anulata TaxID=53371 RepID=A0A8J3FCU2_9ACTN|nr:glutathionylspermidine synthase family protein [Pilimelia anulata]GGJ93233.1 putative glutathionylspermidine synthase [Pilimelia anulata]